MAVAVSENGMTVLTTAPPQQQVPGSNVELRVRPGVVGNVLLYFAGRFDKEVEDIDQARGAPIDDASWNYRYVQDTKVYSNHASASAEDLNWDKHPRGKRGTFTPQQVSAIRRIQADCSGVIQWGGDYVSPSIVDEMHFEVIGTTAQINAAWAKIQTLAQNNKEINVESVLLSKKFAYDVSGDNIVDKASIVTLGGEWANESWLPSIGQASVVFGSHFSVGHVLIRVDFAVQGADGVEYPRQKNVELKGPKNTFAWLHLPDGAFGVSAGLITISDADLDSNISMTLVYGAK